MKVVDNIKFVAEKDISFVFENAKILYKKGVFGPRFEVYNANNVGGSSCGQ